jgi:hypothetical protein
VVDEGPTSAIEPVIVRVCPAETEKVVGPARKKAVPAVLAVELRVPASAVVLTTVREVLGAPRTKTWAPSAAPVPPPPPLLLGLPFWPKAPPGRGCCYWFLPAGAEPAGPPAKDPPPPPPPNPPAPPLPPLAPPPP